MYAPYFGLHKNPFGLTPDPSFLFLTEQHREALVGLTYAITHRQGYVTLTGEVGTGKTTLLARVLQSLPASKLQFSLVMNPTLTPSEFLELVLLDFGVKDVPDSKARRIWILQDLLLKAEQQGKVSALVIDEAHKLSPDLLEEIRLLGNFEASDRKMLQIVLAGQPELGVALRRTDLRQLKQRIAMRLLIRPLLAEEVSKYIRHRWLKAGGGEAPFTPNALNRIAEASRGIPRVINSICDTALISAFASKSPLVEESHVCEAVADLDLSDLAVETIAERQTADEPAKADLQATENVLAGTVGKNVPVLQASGQVTKEIPVLQEEEIPVLQEKARDAVDAAPFEVVPPQLPDLPEKIPIDTKPKHSLWSRWARKFSWTREGAA